MNDYDYLIRLAKWNDHKGDLKTAITFMEKARDIAEKDNRTLKIWSYSNLGDFMVTLAESRIMTVTKNISNRSNYSYALKNCLDCIFS
jgi:hypothetical protein